MSQTTGVFLGRGQSVVVVAGATGNLGFEVSKSLLTTFSPFFSRVVALARDLSTSRAKELVNLGAQVVQVTLNENDAEDVSRLQEALRSVDVVINVLERTDGRQKEVLVDAAVQAGAKVYFPSEFGVDHRLNDFPGFDHVAWDKKREHVKYAEGKSNGRMKIVSIYTGLFLEDSIHARFGFDGPNGKLNPLGSRSVRTTFTAKEDIGRALAQLAILSMNGSTSDDVPAHVRIAGCTLNAEEIKAALARVGKDVVIEESSLEEEKARLREAHLNGTVGMPATHIRILMGEGKLDFSSDNDNELFNPKERLWTWTTLDDIVKDIV